jgi:HTH-type transcriptional repressor of NAD biosynthesis genes
MMPRAFVLMTALPPTPGHLRLVQFAESLADTTVIVSTQPDEPFPAERAHAISEAVSPETSIFHFNQTIEQNPEALGFWQMWRRIFAQYGFHEGDYIVASEPYGKRLAEELGGVFMPYDMNRSITPIKATPVRNNPIGRWDDMIPEFRKNFVQRVTIFGAESCGKTTLSYDLAEEWDAQWLPEWARPYLESVGAEVTYDKMHAIHKGQLALQKSGANLVDAPVLFQDTDLFSTVGYWGLWHPEQEIGQLITDAVDNKSDLYLIAPSNIPFEADALRYGGHERESADQYWIDLCERYNLNYRVLTNSGKYGRVLEAGLHIKPLLKEQIIDPLHYERTYNG